MKFATYLVSILLHPLFSLLYGLLLLLWINPHASGERVMWSADKLILICAIYTVLFPALSILIMRGVGLVKSLDMQTKEERWGPLIVCLVFYFWFYANIRENPNLDDLFISFVLGACIALGLSFLTSIFTKTSLHAVGVGGLTGLLIVIVAFRPSYSVLIGEVVVHPFFLLIIMILLSGLVGTSRLYLQAHRSSDLIAGFLIGFSAQMLAIGIL